MLLTYKNMHRPSAPVTIHISNTDFVYVYEVIFGILNTFQTEILKLEMWHSNSIFIVYKVILGTLDAFQTEILKFDRKN